MEWMNNEFYELFDSSMLSRAAFADRGIFTQSKLFERRSFFMLLESPAFAQSSRLEVETVWSSQSLQCDASCASN